MGYTLSRRKHDRKVLTNYKKMRRITTILHVNSNESNILKTSNIDYVKILLNFPYSIVQNGSSSYTLITLPKIIDIDSSVCIIDKITVLNDINEERSYHKSSS